MSDLNQHDDIHDLLVRAPAPEMHFHLDEAVRLGKRVRLRRRLAAAGGGLAAAAAVALTVTLALPGEPAPTLQPAGPSPSTTTSAESTSLVDTQCFPMDTSVKSTPWIKVTAPNSLPKGGPVYVEARILSGCPNNIRQDVDGPEGKGDFTLDVKFAQKPTTAQWSVGMRSTVLIVPKGQRPCGYSNGKALPTGVRVHSGDWDVVTQPVSDALARFFDGDTTVTICAGDKVVAKDLPQIVGQDLDAEGEFNNRLLKANCDLSVSAGMHADTAVQWIKETVPNYLGGTDVTVDARTHPGAGCTGDWMSTGPLDSNDESKGIRLDIELPEVPKQPIWEGIPVADHVAAAFVLPAGQAVCAIDLADGNVEVDTKKIALEDGWTLQLQLLPDGTNFARMTADICTGTKVTTKNLEPMSNP